MKLRVWAGWAALGIAVTSAVITGTTYVSRWRRLNDAVVSRATRDLANATVSIARAELRDGRLEAEVVVTNTAGHKLPSAYPSRRAWLRVVVSDAHGRALWASGELRPDGSVEGNDNDRDPSAFEPHHRMIDAAADLPPTDALEARVAAHPEDLEARFDLASALIAHRKYADALAQLLDIVKRDRTFRDDIGRKTMLSVFDLAAHQPQLVSEWRRKLSMALN